MWTLILHLMWSDGDFMDMRMHVMGGKHDCIAKAEASH